jgi:hypothetical protein
VKLLAWLLRFPARFEALVSWATEAQAHISGIEARIAKLRPADEAGCSNCRHWGEYEMGGSKYTGCTVSAKGGKTVCLNTCLTYEPKP